jgi:hypothetical protein
LADCWRPAESSVVKLFSGDTSLSERAVLISRDGSFVVCPCQARGAASLRGINVARKEAPVVGPPAGEHRNGAFLSQPALVTPHPRFNETTCSLPGRTMGVARARDRCCRSPSHRLRGLLSAFARSTCRRPGSIHERAEPSPPTTINQRSWQGPSL